MRKNFKLREKRNKIKGDKKNTKYKSCREREREKEGGREGGGGNIWFSYKFRRRQKNYMKKV